MLKNVRGKAERGEWVGYLHGHPQLFQRPRKCTSNFLYNRVRHIIYYYTPENYNENVTPR